MNRVYSYLVFFSFISMQSCTLLYADEKIPRLSVDEQHQLDAEIADIFDNEDDVFAQEAADTAIMQQAIEIKPISPIMLAMRKTWDRMLLLYLWLQQKYARVSLYIKSRFGLVEHSQEGIESKPYMH